VTFPIYIPLGPWHVHPHLFFEALAYELAGLLYWWQRRRRGDVITTDARWAVVAAAALGAALGSRFLAAFEDPHHLTLAGKTIVGGLIGGTAAVEWIKRRLHVNERTGDLFALPLCLGIAVGRIGCFLTGTADDTAGLPTRLPWGVNFGDGIPRHPTQLYEIVFVAILAIVVASLMRAITATTSHPVILSEAELPQSGSTAESKDPANAGVGKGDGNSSATGRGRELSGGTRAANIGGVLRRLKPAQDDSAMGVTAAELLPTTNDQRPTTLFLSGDAFRLFLLAYMTWRFAIDFLKPGVPIAALTALQWGAAATVAWYWRDAARIAKAAFASVETGHAPSLLEPKRAD
jgi:phosphatidylglycerol---prolipoprotein diacylglyceryl transferase